MINLSSLGGDTSANSSNINILEYTYRKTESKASNQAIRLFILNFAKSTSNHFLYCISFYDINNENGPHVCILLAHNRNLNNFYYNVLSSSKRSQYNNNSNQETTYYVTNLLIEKGVNNTKCYFYLKLNTMPKYLYYKYKIFDLSNSFKEPSVFNDWGYTCTEPNNIDISINLQ